VCTEAVAVVRAVGADYFLDRWHVEITSNNSVRHIVLLLDWNVFIARLSTLSHPAQIS
jgi:hypothetical protein